MVTISHSRWKTASRCWKKYYYKYERRLQRRLRGVGASRGGLIHECLKSYYLNDCDLNAIVGPIKEFKKSLKGLMDEERVLYQDFPEEVVRILRSYHHYWKDHKRIKVVKFEGEPLIEREFVLPLVDDIEVKLIIDLIVQDNTGIWVLDHKSTKKSIPSDDFRTTDAQSAIYYWAATVLGIKPVGMMFNYLRTKPPTVPRLLKNGTLSKAQIDTDRLTYLQEIKRHELDVDDYRDYLENLSYKKFFNRIKISRPEAMVRNLLWEVKAQAERMIELQGAESRMFPRSLSNTCDWDCEDYRPLCMAELLEYDTEFMIKAHYEEREARDESKEELEEKR